MATAATFAGLQPGDVTGAGRTGVYQPYAVAYVDRVFGGDVRALARQVGFASRTVLDYGWESGAFATGASRDRVFSWLASIGAPPSRLDDVAWEANGRPLLTRRDDPLNWLYAAPALVGTGFAVAGVLASGSGAVASSGSVTTVGGATSVAPPAVAAGAAPAIPAVASSPGLPAILKVASLGPGIVGQVRTAITGTPVAEYGDPVSADPIPVFRSSTSANWTLLAILAAGAIVVALWGNR